MAEPPQTNQGQAPASPQEPQTKPGWLAKFRSASPIEDRIKLRRSRVRMWVTYGAAWFLFGGGALFVGYLAWNPVTEVPDGQVNNLATAKEIFFVLVPVATSIVTYWFAARRSEEAGQNGGSQG